MSTRSRQLTDRLKAFNDELTAFVANLSQDQWKAICSEQWPVGVTARHIGAGHYAIQELVEMIVNHNQLPPFTEKEVREAANAHARDHAGCSKQEVLDILEKNSSALIDFVSRLNDFDLAQKAYLGLAGRKLTAQEFVEQVVLESGGEHLQSMKAAVGS
ncbi:MAG: DinB family protein [Desulfohalobiaceae bacterium]|nr:DinB family protein [Desulfohalobiaceae bacterium]